MRINLISQTYNVDLSQVKYQTPKKSKYEDKGIKIDKPILNYSLEQARNSGMQRNARTAYHGKRTIP